LVASNRIIRSRRQRSKKPAQSQNSFFCCYPVRQIKTNGANLLFRPAIPVVLKAPLVQSNGTFRDSDVELADIGFDLAYGVTTKKGILALGGLFGSLPTATDDAVGSDQWRFGPEVLTGVIRKWGILGLLINHQWDVGGSNSTPTSITGGQYFYAIGLGGGKQLSAGPKFSYNHNAASGNKTTIPLGIGLSQTKIFKGRPWKFSLQYWYYVESPDLFGPKHTIRLSVAPVVQLPWGKK